MTGSINFLLNGEPAAFSGRADMTVLEWLRSEALLRGTKEGCAEGDCGACSVLVSRSPVSGEPSYEPANSCIMLMGQIEGRSIVTVEGLAQASAGGHPVQKHMAENGSSQCGFCTPGIVVSLAGLLNRNSSPDDHQIHDALAGNLCRCTGYRPIVEAAHQAAEEQVPLLPQLGHLSSASEIGSETDCVFHLPKSLDELLDLKSRNPDATLLAGGTDISLDVAHAKARWPMTICTRDVHELHRLDVHDNHLNIGGAVSWQTMLPMLEEFWPSFATLVRRFGSTQIRSMGTMAGNLATASPIGDGAPALLALNAKLTIIGTDGERICGLDDFFTGYRTCDLQRDEIIKAIHIPLPTDDLQFRVYKISKRYDQDISTVCGAFALNISEGNVRSARIAFGGMAATPMRCSRAEEALAEGRLDAGSIAQYKKAIGDEFAPLSDMRGTADYRLRVARNLVERLAHDLAGEHAEVMAF